MSHFIDAEMSWIFFIITGEIKQVTNNKNTTFSITVCEHTHAHDAVIPRVQETKWLNTARQRYCGLHSHGSSGWRRSGSFHRWPRCQVENDRPKWRHIPLLRQRVRRTLLFEFGASSMTNSHTTLAKSRGAWGSSRWCRACRGRTWGTCTPEADLKRGNIQTGHRWLGK